MVRTQITLTEAQKAQLDRASAATGLSMSELIRRALDHHFAEDRDVDADLAAIDAAFGAWAARDVDGEAYVQRLRSARRPA